MDRGWVVSSLVGSGCITLRHVTNIYRTIRALVRIVKVRDGVHALSDFPMHMKWI